MEITLYMLFWERQKNLLIFVSAVFVWSCPEWSLQNCSMGWKLHVRPYFNNLGTKHDSKYWKAKKKKKKKAKAKSLEMDHGEALLGKNFQVHVTRFIYNFCLYVPHGKCSVIRFARGIHVTTLVKDKLSGNNTNRHVHHNTYFHSFIKQIPFISHRFCYGVLFM